MYSDNLTQKVAQAVAKIMDEELKGNQHKIDANKNGKIDAEDFKLLKKKPVNEVADEDYAAQNVYDKAHMAHMSKHKNIPADKQQAAELEAHKHALETMKMKYPHHTASKGEGQVYRLSQEEVNEGLTGAAIGGTIGGLAGGPVGAAVGGYIGHKVQQTHAKEKALKAAQARNNPPRKKLTKEDQDFINELNKSTLGSYVKRATNQAIVKSLANPADKSDDMKTIDKREKGIRLAVSKLTKEDQDFINELNKSTLGSYVNASARDAVQRTAREVETGRLDKLADKRMKGIKLATKKLAKEETVAEGTYKPEVEKSFPASGVKTGASAPKGTSTMPKNKEKAKGQPAGLPFTPDKPKAKVATPGKFGYGYSAARHLARQGMAGMTKEETEQVEEAITKTSTGYIHHARPGVYGGSEKEKHVVDTLRGPKKSEIEAIEKEKKMKKSFSEMLDLINTHGLKALSGMIKEEPDNEQFTQELKDAQAKSEGKGKKAEVAKAAVQAVKVEEVEINEGKMKDIHIDMMDHADKKGYTSKKQFTKADYETIGKQHGVSGGDIAIVAGHHTADSYSKLKEEVEQLDEYGDDFKNHPRPQISTPKPIGQSGTPSSFDKNKLKPASSIKPIKSEEVEAIDEISARPSIGYSSGMKKPMDKPSMKKPMDNNDDEYMRKLKQQNKLDNYYSYRPKTEEVEQVEERSLTEPEMKKKEEIVKSMKKGLSGFKARYGKDAKSVMYATATKQAKGD